MKRILWLFSFSFRLIGQILAQFQYSANRAILLLNYRWESELLQSSWRRRIYGRKLWWTRFVEDVVGVKDTRFQYALFGVFGPKFLTKIPLPIPKVWLTEEDVEFRFKEYDDHCLKHVQLSLGFRNLEHNNYIRFPYWIYQFIDPGFVSAEGQFGLSGKTKFIPPNEFCSRIRSASRFDGRNRFASIVSRHDSHGSGAGLRGQVMDVLNEIDHVEAAGAWRNNTNALKEEFGDDLTLYLKDCRYNICLENTNSDGYVTEKVFHALLGGSIPIYWGGGVYMEPEVLTGNGIVLLGNSGAHGVAEQVNRLEVDPAYREDWLAQPILTEWANEWIEERVDLLKRKLLELKG